MSFVTLNNVNDSKPSFKIRVFFEGFVTFFRKKANGNNNISSIINQRITFFDVFISCQRAKITIMKVKFFLFLALFGFLMTSCSPRLTPFTQRLYEESNWSKADLKRIQFYLSEDIKLKRALSGGTSEIINGKIKIEDGRKIEEVVIPKMTPGVFLFSPKDNRFAISFEDSDARFLMFGPNPKAGNRYVLLASEWQGRTGKVKYDDKTWRVSADDAIANLMVDLKKIRKVTVNSRTAGGRKVGQ